MLKLGYEYKFFVSFLEIMCSYCLWFLRSI